jgi:hypothetical protein
MAKMKAPKDCGGFSAGGKEYKLFGGVADIDDMAVQAAISHGFTVIDDEEYEKAMKKAADKESAASNLRAKALDKAIHDGETLLKSFERTFKEIGDRLDPVVKQQLYEASGALELAIKAVDLESIMAAADKLDEVLSQVRK